MKKILSVVVVAILITSFTSVVSAQCKGFAKQKGKVDLYPYIHDGNYHAAILTEGEEADLYKTCYADQQYRIVVCGSDNLGKIEFKVIDANRNVLYDNSQHDMSKLWDFKVESSQQLRIVIKVPASGQKKSESDINSGCVAIMFGFKQ
jgi:hypothetical protein